MEAIYSFDFSVFQFVEEYIWNPVLDVIMTVITTLGDGGLIWIACAICLLATKKYRKVGAMVAAGLIISLAVTDGVLKPLIDRPRPFNYEGWLGQFNFPELVEKPTSVSFPSGHTSSSFAAAVPMLLKSKKRIGIPAIILAALVAFSRIYVHVHYCTDVLAGLVMGIIYGLLAVLVVEKLAPMIIKKIKERKAAKNVA